MDVEGRMCARRREDELCLTQISSRRTEQPQREATMTEQEVQEATGKKGSPDPF